MDCKVKFGLIILEFDLYEIDLTDKLYLINDNLEHHSNGIQECLDAINIDNRCAEEKGLLIESYLGNSFVLCQTFITEFTTKIYELHKSCFELGISLKTTNGTKEELICIAIDGAFGISHITQIELINAFANNFKHRAEGLRNPTKEIIKQAFDCLPNNIPKDCRGGAYLLGNQYYVNLNLFFDILHKWSMSIYKLYMNELNTLKNKIT